MNFDKRVAEWVTECFGEKIANHKEMRAYRFFEEASELIQAMGLKREEAYKIVDYVFERPVGEVYQEIAGTMVTLGALSAAYDIDMQQVAEDELVSIWSKIDTIRTRKKNKPIPTNV